MPRYYFHLSTDRVLQRDEEGLDLPGVDAAETAAVRLVRDLTKRLGGENQALELYVQSDTGEVLLTASLTFRKHARQADERPLRRTG